MQRLITKIRALKTKTVLVLKAGFLQNMFVWEWEGKLPYLTLMSYIVLLFNSWPKCHLPWGTGIHFPQFVPDNRHHIWGWAANTIMIRWMQENVIWRWQWWQIMLSTYRQHSILPRAVSREWWRYLFLYSQETNRSQQLRAEPTPGCNQLPGAPLMMMKLTHSDVKWAALSSSQSFRAIIWK